MVNSVDGVNMNIEVGQVWTLKYNAEPICVVNIQNGFVYIDWFWGNGINDWDGMPIEDFLEKYEFYAQPIACHDFKEWCIKRQNPIEQFKPPKATQILTEAVEVMAERGKTYDKSGGQERSMGKTVSAFNALTGHNLTEEQGWAFMAVLKLARSQQGEYKADNYLDGAAYFALMGEAAEMERGQ